MDKGSWVGVLWEGRGGGGVTEAGLYTGEKGHRMRKALEY